MTAPDLTEPAPTPRKISDQALQRILRQMRASILALVGPDFQLLLYGSYARGDQQHDSDVDLMVILPDGRFTFETKQKIRDLMGDFSLHGDYLFCAFIVSESRFKERSGFMVFRSVEREGILI